MESQSIKNDLIAWVNSLNDLGLLKALQRMKSNSEAKDWADDLSPEARASIERGLEDIRNGRTVSSKEFWARRGR